MMLIGFSFNSLSKKIKAACGGLWGVAVDGRGQLAGG